MSETEWMRFDHGMPQTIRFLEDPEYFEEHWVRVPARSAPQRVEHTTDADCIHCANGERLAYRWTAKVEDAADGEEKMISFGPALMSEIIKVLSGAWANVTIRVERESIPGGHRIGAAGYNVNLVSYDDMPLEPSLPEQYGDHYLEPENQCRGECFFCDEKLKEDVWGYKHCSECDRIGDKDGREQNNTSR